MKFLKLFSLAAMSVAMLAACNGGRETDDAATARSDTRAAPTNVVRFIVVGDTGSGSNGQYAVGEAMAEVCASWGCDFVVGLGDNIYESGTSSALDPQFDEKFEIPFAPVDLPFYMVLGNHDNSRFFGGDGAGNATGETQVDYHYRDLEHPDQPRLTNRWQMPARYYKFTEGRYGGAPLVEFFAIDSSQPAGGFPDSDENYSYNKYGLAQVEWLKNGIEASQAQWKIVLSHHPYVSNGSHGNAGNYDGVPGALLPVLAGQRYKDFLQEAMCDRADYLLTGHDHDLQWLEPQADCGRTGFIVSGAGSKHRSLENRNENPYYYQAGDRYGFFWVEIRDRQFESAVFEVDPTLDDLGIRDDSGKLSPAFRREHAQMEPQGLESGTPFSGVPFLGLSSGAAPATGATYQEQSGPLDLAQDGLSNGLIALAQTLPDNAANAALMALAESARLALDSPDALLQGLARVEITGNPDTARAGAALAAQALLASIDQLEMAVSELAASSPRYAALPDLFTQYRAGTLAGSAESGGLARLLAPVIALVRNIENIVDGIEEETDPIPVLDPALHMVATLLLDVTDVLVAASEPSTSAISEELVFSIDNLLQNLLVRVIPIEQFAPDAAPSVALGPQFLSSVLLAVLREPTYLLDPVLRPILEPADGILDAILGILLPPS